MFCVRCQKDVYYCTCPDIEERLRAISEHKNWAVEWCSGCDKAVSRCDCPDAPREEQNIVFRSFGKLIKWVTTR